MATWPHVWSVFVLQGLKPPLVWGVFLLVSPSKPPKSVGPRVISPEAQALASIAKAAAENSTEGPELVKRFLASARAEWLKLKPDSQWIPRLLGKGPQGDALENQQSDGSVKFGVPTCPLFGKGFAMLE